jgi:hypothetical protein
MKFSNAIGKLHCGAGFNTGQKQKTPSVPGRLWSMYIRAVEWNLTTGLLTVCPLHVVITVDGDETDCLSYVLDLL